MKPFTYATSPYARKVRMMLDYKGIAYEPTERCYSLDRKEDLLEVNVRAEVPTLVLDDGRVIGDWAIIGEYLEDAFPQPSLRPDDAYQRARMRKLTISAIALSMRSPSVTFSASCAEFP